MKKQIKSVFQFIAIVCFVLTLASCGGRGKAVNQLDDMYRGMKTPLSKVEEPRSGKPKRGGDKSDPFTTGEDEEESGNEGQSQATGTWMPPNYGQQKVTQEQVDEMWRQLHQLMGGAQQLTGYPMTLQPPPQFTQEQMDEMQREWQRIQSETQRVMNNNYQFQNY